jgi:hypothetical protein
MAEYYMKLTDGEAKRARFFGDKLSTVVFSAVALT